MKPERRWGSAVKNQGETGNFDRGSTEPWSARFFLFFLFFLTEQRHLAKPILCVGDVAEEVILDRWLYGVLKKRTVVKAEHPASLHALTFHRYCLPALRLAT